MIMSMANTHSLKNLLKSIYTEPVSPSLFPISINWQQGTYLASLVGAYNPKTVLELGSGFGVSSVWIQSKLARKSTHIAIDPWAEHLPEIEKVLAHTNYSLVTSATSQEYLARMDHARKQKVDLIFMDADERFDGCLTDCYFSNRILNENGLIVIRNIWNPSVRRVCQFVITNLPYQLIGVPLWINWWIKHMPPLGNGFIIYLATRFYSAELCVLKKVNADLRPWHHFRPFC